MVIRNLQLKILVLQTLVVIHFVEELCFGFPAWASRHFGSTSMGWYLLSHAFLIGCWGIIAYLYTQKKLWALMAIFAVQTIIFTNGFFHLTTWLLFDEYSPGVVSQIVLIPVSLLVFYLFWRYRILGIRNIIFSIIIGTLTSGLIILSLMLHI